MRRVQLFEFNERSECPAFIREALIETLGDGLRLGGIYKNVAPIFSEFCKQVGAKKVLDLCSGSGEPVSIFLSALESQSQPLPHFTISDLLPNRSAMQTVSDRHPNRISPIFTPVDATQVPEDLSFPACTIISAFHHFDPHTAQRILQNCVERNRAVFIVEPFTSNIKRAPAPVPALATAAYFHPLKAQKQKLLRAFFTYAVPMIPMIGAWDATVSFLRIYSKESLFEMVSPFKHEFEWHYEEVSYNPFGKALVFYGLPRNSPATH